MKKKVATKRGLSAQFNLIIKAFNCKSCRQPKARKNKLVFNIHSKNQNKKEANVSQIESFGNVVIFSKIAAVFC